MAIVSEANVSIDENHTTIIKVLTTDPDFDTPTFSLSAGADMSLFSIDSVSGLLSFINPPDFETPLSSNNNNTYQVEVTATDDGNPQETASQLITVSVLDLTETSPIDLVVQLAANTARANPEDVIEFTITVTNTGTEDAVDAFIFDILPTEISNTTWTCVATGTATCSASGTGEIADLINIPNDSSTITYTILATISAANFKQFNCRVFVDSNEPQFDTNLADNSDDVLILGNILFSNGFED